MWRGPTEGRVRVISPYRARARRVAQLFVCSMQDGDFPRRDTGGPLLSDDSRRALGLPRAKEGRGRGPIPLRGLPLAAEAAPLALLAERRRRGRRDLAVAVRRRGARAARPGAARRTSRSVTRRSPPRPAAGDWRSRSSAPARRPASASSPRARGGGRPGPGKAVCDPGAAAARAGARADAGNKLFGPSTLEEYALCPYRWFIGHELNPQRIGPRRSR